MPALASSFAYVPGGERLQWAEGARVPLAVNVRNVAGLSRPQVEAAVSHAVGQWQAAAGDRIAFDLWSGDDSEVFVPRLERDGLSSVYFLSQDLDGSRLGGRRAGYTQLYFDPDTGEVAEIDLVLNDLDYGLTTDPELTSYDGLLGRTILLQDVMTHEIGHALGLGHSGGVSSTMFPAAWPEQATLSCEDVAAIRELYGPEVGTTVSGVLESEAGLPVGGARVELWSPGLQAVVGATLTHPDGTFVIGGVEPGAVAVSTLPWRGEDDDLDAYYAPSVSHPCPEAAGRQFVDVASDGRLGLLEVGANPVDAGVVVLSCEGPGTGVPLTSAGETVDEAPLMLDGAPETAWVALHPDRDERRYYGLGPLEGALTVHATTWSLLSPARVLLDLVRPDGDPTPAVPTEVSRELEGGALAWDARLSADALPPADYALEVRVGRLSDDVFPWPGWGDTEAFTLFSVGTTVPPDDPCALQSDPAAVVWRTGLPYRAEVPGSAGSCDGCSSSPTGALALPLWLLLGLARRRAWVRS